MEYYATGCELRMPHHIQACFPRGSQVAYRSPKTRIPFTSEFEIRVGTTCRLTPLRYHAVRMVLQIFVVSDETLVGFTLLSVQPGC